MTLPKARIEAHRAAERLLEKEVLTADERLFVLKNWTPQAVGTVADTGTFFTPAEIAREFATFCAGACRTIDICAGIGSLAFHLIQDLRGDPDRNRLELVCVEKNPLFVKVGRKVVPEAK